MGWEWRGDKRYYYRSKWVNGRTEKEYFGSGPAAEEAARQDAEAAAQRRRDRDAILQYQAEIAAIDEPLAELCALCDAVVAVTLAEAGYHRHDRGPWRKKRVKREVSKTAETPNGSGA